MSFLPRINHLITGSIRRQLIIGIALVHAVLMTLFVLDLVARQRAFLHEQSLVAAESLAGTLAANSTSWVLAADIFGLEEVVHSQSRYPGLRYAMVVDRSGRVLGHSDSMQVGRHLADPVSLSLLSGPAGPRTLISNDALVDVAIPIQKGGDTLGWARVALDHSAISAALALVSRDGAVYILAAIVVGTIFAMFMASGMTGALRRLVDVANATRTGQRDRRAASVRRDELGQLAHAMNDMLDAMAASEKALRISEERFDLAMRGASDGVWDWDITTNRVYFSPRWKDMIGWEPHEISERHEEFTRRVHPDDLDAVMADVEAYLAGRIPKFERELRIQHRDGSWRWVLTRGVAVRDAEGRAVRLVGTHVDITELKQAQQALHTEKEKAQVTLAAIADAVITTDLEGRVDYMNLAAERLTGWHNDEARGHLLSEVMRLQDEDGTGFVESPVARCLMEDRVIELTRHALLLNRGDDVIAVEDSAAPIHDPHGRLIGAVAVFHDVTENRRMARELSYQATHDMLTGLVNRRELERRLSQAVESAHERRAEHSFAYLDLDQFKVVNDTCGHTAGDELLKQLTPVIAQSVRAHDTVARIGGDEFGLLLEHCPLWEAEAVTQKVLDAINDFRFTWDDKVFSIGVSIGLVSVTSSTRGAIEVLSAADTACYTAKEQGRNRVYVQRQHDPEYHDMRGQMALVSKIQEALAKGQFLLFCQPIEPLGTVGGSRHPHFEILVRMGQNAKDSMPPGAFIPAAERYNIMPAIDRWIVENFLAWLAANPEQKPRGIWCVNLSGASLGSEGFAEFILQRIAHHEVPADRLCFEITETSAIANLSRAGRFIRQLRQAGCRFALDDFGSGMSSFTYLKNLPVDYLKIDGHFVRDVVEDAVDRAMVSAINHIGHTVGLETIAEFVEDDAIRRTLEEMGVDYAQGYAIARPMPLEQMLLESAPNVKTAR